MESNKVYKIDLDTRAVLVPAGEVIGVYHDKDVNRLTFEVPGIYKGIDLTGYQISINYMNEEEQKDVYLVEDTLVTMNMNNQSESIRFSWLVGATACAVPGTVSFTICFKKLDSEGNIINEINTKLTRMKVLEGCEAVESEIEERYMTDLAGQLYKELDEVKKHGSDVKKRLAAVITEKGVETASTDSFNTMAENIKSIKGDSVVSKSNNTKGTFSDVYIGITKSNNTKGTFSDALAWMMSTTSSQVQEG